MDSNDQHHRPLLLTPGPIEFSKSVLKATNRHGTSHTDPHFVNVFSESLEMIRQVFLTRDGQPFVLSGSGTLGWDMFASSILCPQDRVLLPSLGYFGDRFGDCLEAYGVSVEYLRSDPGYRPSVEALLCALQSSNFSALVITHVDTSSGVTSDLKEYCVQARRLCPDILIIVDGVCALAGEEMRMDEWDIDGYLTGSQKSLGVPPGLSISVIRTRALLRLQKRDTPIPSYYANMKNWLPIMQSYEKRTPSYFATPAVNLIYGLHQGLKEILANGGVEQRFVEHRAISTAFRKAIFSLGLQIMAQPGSEAATLTAIYFPKQVSNPAAFLKTLCENGVIASSGILKGIAHSYFRVGHMGESTRKQHLLVAIKAIAKTIQMCCGDQVINVDDAVLIFTETLEDFLPRLPSL